MAEEQLKTLGRYQISAELGRGGFAVVYRALDPNLDREVALKVMHPTLLNDPSFTQRFRREAKALASLRHPNIITIYEVSEADGRLYISMELANGSSMADYIGKVGKIPWKEALKLIKPMCEALDYAHTQGVVHRDLKPANILVDKDRGPLLTDFGLARLLSAGSNSVSMTMSGGIMGTPSYIAPEVWEMETAGPPADIYSMGCIVHEMITGSLLFAGLTPMQILRAHDKGPQYPAAWPDGVPTGIEAVLNKALSRQPADRYPNALGLWQDLEDAETDARTTAERAQQAALAAEWQAAVQEAIQAQEWGTARMALGRWLAVTPGDPAALAARAEIERRLATQQSAPVPVDQPGDVTLQPAPAPQAPAQPVQNISVQTNANPPVPFQNTPGQSWQPAPVETQPAAYAPSLPVYNHSQSGAAIVQPAAARSRDQLPWVLGVVGLLIVGVVAIAMILNGGSTPPVDIPPQSTAVVNEIIPSIAPTEPSSQIPVTGDSIVQQSDTPTEVPIVMPTDVPTEVPIPQAQPATQAKTLVLWDSSHGPRISHDSGNPAYDPTGKYSALVALLEGKGIDNVENNTQDIASLDLSSYGVIVIDEWSAQNRAYDGNDVGVITHFLENGGSLLILAETPDSPKHVSAIAEIFGVGVGNEHAPDEIPIKVVPYLPITQGISSLQFLNNGGTFAFAGDFMKTVGASSGQFAILATHPSQPNRVMIIGDANLFDNDGLILADNEQFAVNVFSWLTYLTDNQ